MSKSLLIILLGAITGLAIAIFGAIVVVGLSYFQITDSVTVGNPTATPIALVSTPTAQLPATATSTVESIATPTATVVTPLATVPPQPTAIEVSTTTVQYVQALTDINIRSGPGTGYRVVGWVAGGQTAKVTGVNSVTGWWRVVCPDGTTGNCRVTGATRYTKATSSPVVQPQPTATSAACTNAASFVADVTVPDNSQILATSTFVKTWRIKNSGTCTWDGRYHLVHAGGPTLSAVVETLQMPATVAPGQTVDLTLTMMAPVTPGSYQSDWKLRTPQNSFFGVGSNNAPLWVKIGVVSPQPTNTTISGLVYQDINQNGVYNSDEPLMANREIWLAPGTACHVRQNAVAAVFSGNDGRYTFSGPFNGSYCIGLVGNGGLDDVVSVAVVTGQVMKEINLRSAVPNMSISGFVWNDTCLVDQTGNVVEGICMNNGTGGVRANGMLEATETYIGGVTVLLRQGACDRNDAVPVLTVTDNTGKYIFSNLTPGTYCVYIVATAPENVTPLLPGEFSFPLSGSHDIELRAGTSAFPVNFGWDYQLK